jgi:hypothetical protein
MMGGYDKIVKARGKATMQDEFERLLLGFCGSVATFFLWTIKHLRACRLKTTGYTSVS